MATVDSRIAARSGGGDSHTSLRGKLVLTSADIRDLYETARSLSGLGGAPYLNRLFDAASAIDTGQLDRAEQILARTRQEYEKSHVRLLRFSSEEGGDRKKQREDTRLAAKRQQVEEVLGQFDAYLAIVERMIELAARRSEDAQRSDLSRTLPNGFPQEFEAEQTPDGQFAVVERHFAPRPVGSVNDLLPDSLYFLRTRASGYVLRTSADPPGEVVRMTDVLTGQVVRPQPSEALLQQAVKGKFFALARRKPVDTGEPPGEPDDRDDADAASTDPLEARNELLDRQLFNVLMLAVKQSGLKISTDTIVQIRDNQFRKGEFHDAFEKLNQFSMRYEMLAARRKEQLRQHDQWLSSGQSGLSMREVELAKLRNANERTRLDHGSHRFGLVVEPLRILARGG